MKRLIQLAVAALLVAAPAQAVRRYSCDFETEAARNRWTLNPTANQTIANRIKNKWYIGEPGNNSKTGQFGLFISDDNGASAHYQNNSCWNFAYDTIALDPSTVGDYTIYFDWCCMANVASDFDGLYLFWIPDSIAVRSNAMNAIPKLYENYIIPLQPNANMDYLNGTSTWRQCVATIPNSQCDGTRHCLAFVWTNGSNQAQQPGAMIDNIYITDDAPCDAPTNLVVTPNGTTVSLSWTGDQTMDYEVTAYSYDGEAWYGPKIVTGTQTNFTGLPIGQTDFIVRTKCAEDFYSLKTIVSKLIYYPDQLCVDYLNLDNATCYMANSSTHSSTSTYTDFKQVPAVDLGPSNVNSLHVVHFDRNEYEPRTLYQAKTVPDGELASIRLGNWDDDEFAERIEFSFDVDTIKYPVLLLKYLPILEAPNHDDDENPRFMLDMLINGVSIGRCGMADFNANSVRQNGQLTPAAIRQGWHYIPSGVVEGGYTDIFWKDWTTVGVNLKKPEYQGKKLTVRLTTFDCVFNAHFGYAYFTLGCSDGKLKGMKCGEINPVFEAPDGFEYRWAYAYNEKYRRKRDGSIPEQYVLGRGQTYEAGMMDDSLYVVDCMFVQDSTCFFSLYASTLATNPISKMKKPHVIRSCRDSIYQVKFDASPSWVQEIDHVKGDTLVSKTYHIEYYEWNIEGLPYGWSDEVSPTFDFPMEGGDYHVTLRTTCGVCEDVLHYDLHLEPLGPTHETQTYTLCDDDRRGNGFEWKERNDTTYRTYGLVDSVVLTSVATSCDSVIYLELKEPARLFVDTMVLPEDLPYVIAGHEYTATTVDTIPAWNLNCDLTYVLNLEVYESLIVNPKTTYVRCEGDGDSLLLEWEITRGRSEAVLYTFDGSAQDTIYNTEKVKGHYAEAIYVGAGLKPNVYNGTLYLVDLKPEFSVKVDYTLTVNYASAVIAQRWNDVLAIRNEDFNGGYQFDSVQWYVSGQPIDGATDFVYYTGGDVTLRYGEEYTALLTRNDGVKLFTCAYVPMPVAANVSDMPSLVPPSSSLQINGKGTAVWYDMLGRLHHSDPYDHSDITTPAVAGYYLLVLQAEDANSIHRIMVK